MWIMMKESSGMFPFNRHAVSNDAASMLYDLTPQAADG
jgi:hypothetical protein